MKQTHNVDYNMLPFLIMNVMQSMRLGENAPMKQWQHELQDPNAFSVLILMNHPPTSQLVTWDQWMLNVLIVMLCDGQES